MLSKIFTLIFSAAVLTGCVTPGSSVFDRRVPNVDDSAKLPDDMCYVALGINNRQVGQGGGEMSLFLTHAEMGMLVNAVVSIPSNTDSTFRLMALKPGKYQFHRFNLGRFHGSFKDREGLHNTGWSE